MVDAVSLVIAILAITLAAVAIAIGIISYNKVGQTGPPGPKGANGSNGTNGNNGSTGATGPTGPRGATGATGARGLNGSIAPLGTWNYITLPTSTVPIELNAPLTGNYYYYSLGTPGSIIVNFDPGFNPGYSFIIQHFNADSGDPINVIARGYGTRDFILARLSFNQSVTIFKLNDINQGNGGFNAILNTVAPR